MDTQTALTYYGAWQYVENVITLSSPHHGSQLADLSKHITFDQAGEVYNITIHVEGLTTNGDVFKRTIVDSVYAK